MFGGGCKQRVSAPVMIGNGPCMTSAEPGGSHLLSSGFKLSDISRWYGHGDIKTTMRYLRVVDDIQPDPEELPL